MTAGRTKEGSCILLLSVYASRELLGLKHGGQKLGPALGTQDFLSLSESESDPESLSGHAGVKFRLLLVVTELSPGQSTIITITFYSLRPSEGTKQVLPTPRQRA